MELRLFDPTIHPRTLVRHFRPADFVADNQLLDGAYKANVIEEAVKIGVAGFTGLSVLTNKLRGKEVYQIQDMAQKLVLRHVNKNIRYLTGVKQDDRQFIIKCLRSLVSEGTMFRAYKFDIKSFYENVSPHEVVLSLQSDIGFSGQSAAALKSFFVQLDQLGIKGLPRGLGLSATLAEYLLRPFDDVVANANGVWFYARFVDDIFIITDGRENQKSFETLVASALPKGLEFNSKSDCMDFGAFKKNDTGLENEFDFLGYRFEVHKPERVGLANKIARKVTLDIAPSKVRRIKSRVAISLLKFSDDGDYVALRDRIRILTSNFNFVDRNTGVRRVAGIYFNYPLVQYENSNALPALDRFLRNALMSGNPKNSLFPTLSDEQRQQLVQLSFSKGFKMKRFFSYGPVRLKQITSCWSHA